MQAVSIRRHWLWLLIVPHWCQDAKEEDSAESSVLALVRLCEGSAGVQAVHGMRPNPFTLLRVLPCLPYLPCNQQVRLPACLWHRSHVVFVMFSQAAGGTEALCLVLNNRSLAVQYAAARALFHLVAVREAWSLMLQMAICPTLENLLESCDDRLVIAEINDGACCLLTLSADSASSSMRSVVY